jgi:hypothetical protein
MAKRPKLPKSIAGVKVPKRLRKSKVLGSILRNPIAQVVLAEAAVAAVAAAAAAIARNRPSGSQLAHAGVVANETLGSAASATTNAASSSKDLLSNLASEMLGGILPSGKGKRRKTKRQTRGDRQRKDEVSSSRH